MNPSGTELKSRSGPVVSSTANTRLSGSRLIIARAIWLALVVPGIGLYIASLPVYYTQLQTACVGPLACNIAGALTAKGLQALPAMGFSASGYATFITIFFAVIVTIWSGIGFLLFWHRSDEWFVLLASFFLVMFNITYPGSSISVLPLVYPALNVPISLMSALGQVSIVLFLLLFPNGRLAPRWMGLILLAAIIQIVSVVFPPNSPLNSNNWPAWLNGLVNVVGYLAVIFSQIYRYRRVSTPVERQQTKWVVLGIITVVTGFIVLDPLFNSLFSALNQPNTPSSVMLTLTYPLLLLLLPLLIGTAILRYRLYDIDVLINRTLVYATLTVLLALIYFGLVIGLESLIRLFTGQGGQSPVVIVASTLAIAALFQPLRHRIQVIIDHRFYRRKYDAVHTLAAFSATLRDEVDLNQLREHLVAVVEETMQPTHVSLWLHQPIKLEPPHSDSNPYL